jgi:hypothetical protein
MTSMLIPLALNELLDRPSIASFNHASGFLSSATQDLILLFHKACLTLELTRRESTTSCGKFSIKGWLIPLASNELLDFVRRDYSAFPDPALTILAFNAPDAAWRFTSPEHQLALSVRGSQHSSYFIIQEICRFIKTQDR